MAEPIVHLSIPVDDLDAARDFYTEALGCRIGRVRDDWLDVWFFGMQLTLQVRPDEVRPPSDQGVRHFGVVLGNEADYLALVRHLDEQGVRWLTAPESHSAPELSGKVGGKLADPAGNIIEVKWYGDPTDHRADADRA